MKFPWAKKVETLIELKELFPKGKAAEKISKKYDYCLTRIKERSEDPENYPHIKKVKDTFVRYIELFEERRQMNLKDDSASKLLPDMKLALYTKDCLKEFTSTEGLAPRALGNIIKDTISTFHDNVSRTPHIRVYEFPEKYLQTLKNKWQEKIGSEPPSDDELRRR